MMSEDIIADTEEALNRQLSPGARFMILTHSEDRALLVQEWDEKVGCCHTTAQNYLYAAHKAGICEKIDDNGRTRFQF